MHEDPDFICLTICYGYVLICQQQCMPYRPELIRRLPLGLTDSEKWRRVDSARVLPNGRYALGDLDSSGIQDRKAILHNVMRTTAPPE